MTQYTNIIEHVFSTSAGLLKIDTLEIDLGNIQSTDISSADVLSVFREMLQQKINSLSVDNSGQIQHINSKQSLQLTTEAGQEAELLESVMITGDIPWWADKSDQPDIDAIVRKMMDMNPEVLSNLLQQKLQRPELLLRLFAYMKPSTISIIEDRLPALSRVLLKETMTEQALHNSNTSVKANLHNETVSIKKSILPQTASAAQDLLQYIKEIAGEKQDTMNAFRALLTKRLIQFLRSIHEQKLFVKAIPLEHVFVNLGLQQFLPREKNNYLNTAPVHKNELAIVVDRLPVFEAALLLQALDNYFDNHDFTPEADLSDQQRQTLTASHEFVAPANISGTREISAIKEKAQFPKHNETDHKDIPEASVTDNKPADEKETMLKNESFSLNENRQQEQDTAQEHPQQNSKVNAEDKIRATDQPLNLSNENKTADNTQNENLDSSQSDRKNKMIAFIESRLKISHDSWLHYLRELDETAIEQLAILFEEKQVQQTAFKRMVDDLCEHPHLLQKDILSIFAQLAKHINKLPAHTTTPVAGKKSADKEKEAIFTRIQDMAASSSLFAFIRKMPSHEYFIIKDIIAKKRFDTAAEKKAIKKLLNKLPQQDIAVLKFLVELEPAQLEQLAALAATLPEKSEPANQSAYPPDKEKEQHGVRVENAGLCLLAAYLPAFFKALGYLQDGQFKTRLAAIRAVYLLQWMVTGKTTRPEYLLQLNKLLCGMDATEMAFHQIRLTKKERQEADELIKAVISNWRSVKNTSIAGFRDSFLQRKGIVIQSEQVWTIRVEKKGFDVLLNTIPWSFRLIKLPWMKKMIEVEW